MIRFVISIPLIALVIVVIMLGVGIKHADEVGFIPSPLIGRPAPRFKLPSLTEPNRLVDSQELHGHWYVLNVWGTWCSECRAEHDMLLEIQRAGVVPVVGLDWEDDDARALSWLSQLGNPYKEVVADREGRAAINLGVYGAPETFLMNPDGIVLYKHVGALTQEVWDRNFSIHLPKF